MGWTAADIERANGRKGGIKAATKAPQATPVPAAAVAVASVVAPVSGVFPASAAAARTHLVGDYAVSVGGRLHAEQLPGRPRLVVTGPASDELTAAVVAAITQIVTPKP